VMASLIKDDKMGEAVSNYEVLKTEYPKSAYTSMAAMMMAKSRLIAGQLDLAAGDLKFAMEHAKPAPVQLIARARLARLRLSQGDTDAALKLLDESPSTVGFEAQFAEIRGDIYLAKGDTEMAISSYQTALDTLEESVGNREFLMIKLEALGATLAGAADVDTTADGGEM